MAVIEHHSSGLNVVDGAAYVAVRPVGEGYSISGHLLVTRNRMANEPTNEQE